MTFEGLSFSWRLKAEVYRAYPAEITLRYKDFIARHESSPSTIQWNLWKGDRAIYRQLNPEGIRWEELPEILVLFEPALGERIIYNPFAGGGAEKTEAEMRARAESICRDLFGRAPDKIQRTLSGVEIANGYAAAVRARGGSVPAEGDRLIAAVARMHGRKGDGQMLPFLRRIHPFALEPDFSPSTGFLSIEDNALLSASEGGTQIDRTKWRNGPAMQNHSGPKLVHVGAEPLILHALAIAGLRSALPQFCLIDRQDSPNSAPEISWDYARDLSPSKQMHISTHPFLLRRYARIVADELEKQTGVRPQVHALTSLSMNLRPPQPFVDPKADLASVPAHFMSHNPWILDLELPRIPPDALRDLGQAQARSAKPGVIAPKPEFWRD